MPEGGDLCCETLSSGHNIATASMSSQSCGYLPKTYTRLGPPTFFFMDGGGTYDVPPLSNDLVQLTVVKKHVYFLQWCNHC